MDKMLYTIKFLISTKLSNDNCMIYLSGQIEQFWILLKQKPSRLQMVIFHDLDRIWQNLTR